MYVPDITTKTEINLRLGTKTICRSYSSLRRSIYWTELFHSLKEFISPDFKNTGMVQFSQTAKANRGGWNFIML